MHLENTRTRFEAVIERALERRTGSRDSNTSSTQFKIQLFGSAAPLSLAYGLSQLTTKLLTRRPQLILVSQNQVAFQLQKIFEFFDPHIQSETIFTFDVLPYSGLFPRKEEIFQRLRFLHRSLEAKPGQMFIGTWGGLAQKTLPASVFMDNVFSLRVGQQLPNDFSARMQSLGYELTPIVEDRGQFAVRGGVVDVFSVLEDTPIRVELFGDEVFSLRPFSLQDQRSLEAPHKKDSLVIGPASEILFDDENLEAVVSSVRKDLEGRPIDPEEREETLRSLVLKNRFPGLEYLLPYFYSKPGLVSDFLGACNLWVLDESEIERSADALIQELKTSYENSEAVFARPPVDSFYSPPQFHSAEVTVELSGLEALDKQDGFDWREEYRSQKVPDFSSILKSSTFGSESWIGLFKTKLMAWIETSFNVVISARSPALFERLASVLDRSELPFIKASKSEFSWDEWFGNRNTPGRIFLVPRYLPESLRLDEEKVVFLTEDDFFGHKDRSSSRRNSSQDFQKQARRLSFGDLRPGDFVVHIKHGIGQYDGLKIMSIGGVESEYIQLSYKDSDKLYLPVYRVGQLQKYASQVSHISPDKLGGSGWEKTKVSVRSHLKDIASELIKLYAQRAELHRLPLRFDEKDMIEFERGFPFEETEDQQRAIDDILKDFRGTKPMDRLICGDVGFGKTEVAMRAAFAALKAGKQVALLAPTTVLTYQHFETLKKRFQGWPFEIRVLNRFVSPSDSKKTLLQVKEGVVHLIVGTHRLLSRDVIFKDLGLLIIDEEQKFGVSHKEKIKKLKLAVDTISMSATPIPRTLNMSLMGVRDLSLINTAPIDRLPIRTFISKFDGETIRKAVQSEVQRGGQVYFIHNRVQSIYSLADELREILPNVRLKVAHGQMAEDRLEEVMLEFFNHQIDVLLSTAIVESGVDNPRANTMFIDQAQLFGLSQLYQLRGRVGRSKQRAYCYLILPRGRKLDKTAEERLKVIQENTSLGSGIKIAQYDLELRGAGNILGDDQSGHIDAVGYELYMDLLQEALSEAKGLPVDDKDLDPEINLRIPALIPDKYINDIRLRLSYYKALAEIRNEEDLEKIESELKDQFGDPPEPVVNLMGLMLIRALCKDLGVRDISAGLKTISLIFSEKTLMKPEVVIQLAMQENKKYSITPDNRLNVRLNNITWPAVLEELNQLVRRLPH